MHQTKKKPICHLLPHSYGEHNVNEKEDPFGSNDINRIRPVYYEHMRNILSSHTDRLLFVLFFRFPHNKTQRSAKCVHDQNGAFLIQTCESMSNSLIDDDVAFDWVRRRISYRETQYNGDGQFSSTLEKDYNRIRIFRYVKSHRAHLCIRAQRSAMINA